MPKNKIPRAATIWVLKKAILETERILDTLRLAETSPTIALAIDLYGAQLESQHTELARLQAKRPP